MLLPHGGWPIAAGPVSRLGSFDDEEGDEAWYSHVASATAPFTKGTRSKSAAKEHELYMRIPSADASRPVRAVTVRGGCRRRPGAGR